jgi:cobalt transporter subunit CbtB
MTTISAAQSTQKKVISIALSVEMQMALFFALCTLTVWTIYFNTYPPIHDATHALRHHTLGVPCH